MKSLHKLAQQRRRQLHVHLPPSGLNQVAYEAPWQRHGISPLQTPPRLCDNAAQCPASTPAFIAQQQGHSTHSLL